MSGFTISVKREKKESITLIRHHFKIFILFVVNVLDVSLFDLVSTLMGNLKSSPNISRCFSRTDSIEFRSIQTAIENAHCFRIPIASNRSFSLIWRVDRGTLVVPSSKVYPLRTSFHICGSMPFMCTAILCFQ